jgi:hypothetical protein
MTPKKALDDKKDTPPAPVHLEPRRKKPVSGEKRKKPLFIVGIGGSAGSLEALGQSIFLIIPEAERKENDRQLQLLRRGENLTAVKTQRKTRQGALLTVRSSATSLTYEGGQTIAIAITDSHLPKNHQRGKENQNGKE